MSHLLILGGFQIGINDIGNSYYLSGDRSAFSDTLLDAYFALVHQIYDRGGRNFLFFTVPGVDRSPLVRLLLPSPRIKQFTLFYDA